MRAPDLSLSAVVSSPFAALFALRRRYFRAQSRALYQRYGHALGIFGAFLAVVLVERPTVLAGPLLHAWRDPADWRTGLCYLIGWAAVVAVWARVHRGFVRGAALAVFVRTTPHGARIAHRLDLALVLVALQPFALPFVIAAWTVLAADAFSAAGAARFWGTFVVMLLSTVALARAVVFETGRARWLRLFAAGAMPTCAGPLGTGPAGVLLAAAALLLAADLAWPIMPRKAARRDASATGTLRGPGLWFLVRLQWSALWRSHRQVLLPRTGFALALLAAAWWMIYSVGKHADAHGFIKVACCATAYLLSGLYYAFWSARQPLQPFLRSLPLGMHRTLAAEHVAVLGVGMLVFAVAWLGYRCLPAEGPVLLDWLAYCALSSLALLALLGAPILQRHQQGVVGKVALTVTLLLLL